MKIKTALGVLVILSILVMGVTSAFASPYYGLQFYPTKVAFADDHTLAVTGVFWLKSNSEYTSYLPAMNIYAEVLTNHGWKTIKGKVKDIGINAMKEQTFYIPANKMEFTAWKVKTVY
ncbi:MAG: hypothetical protein H6Q67_1576 [Firmicutes bacterium]|nr:hypothetical protein [Bacillota bacterium]